MNNEEFFDVVEALDAALSTAEPTKRKLLATAIDVYAAEHPADFQWATGAQAPSLLAFLLTTICSGAKSPLPSRRVLRLIDREREGSA
jgi:hypothetical protein